MSALATFLPLTNCEYVSGTHKVASVSPREFLFGLQSLLVSQEPVDLFSSRVGDGTISVLPAAKQYARAPLVYVVAELGRDDPPSEITYSFAGARISVGGLENGAADVPIASSAFTTSVSAKVLDPGAKSAFLWIPCVTVQAGEWMPMAPQFYWDDSTAAAHKGVVTTVTGSPAGGTLRTYFITPGARYWRATLAKLMDDRFMAAAHEGRAESGRSTWLLS